MAGNAAVGVAGGGTASLAAGIVSAAVCIGVGHACIVPGVCRRYRIIRMGNVEACAADITVRYRLCRSASNNGRAKANNNMDSTAANGRLCRSMARMVVACGPGLYGVRFTGSLYYLKSLRRPAALTSMDEEWQQRFDDLARAVGLKRKVVLAVSARITSPLTMGNLSPIVLLPAGLITGLSTTQLESILVHELYHIKRRDYLVNILQAWVEVLMFYHPALWHISRIVRDERENCCDDLTLALCGDPVPYARALTQIHETNSLTKPTLAMSVSGPAGSFAIRIKRLFNIYPNPARARSKGLFAIGLLLTCMGLLLMSANALPVSSANTVHSAIKPVVLPATIKADTVPPDTSKLRDVVVDGYRTSPDKKGGQPPPRGTGTTKR